VIEVQQHFQSIGFDLPPRMDVPSWLVEITTPSGKHVLQHRSSISSCLSCKCGVCMSTCSNLDRARSIDNTRVCLLSAGQFRYASSKLKAICCKQHAGSLRAIALKASAAEQQPQDSSVQQSKPQEPAGAAADAEEQPPVDASGKHVLLRSVDEMADAFWKESKLGTALLQEVCCMVRPV
jgi:hypothetical protein